MTRWASLALLLLLPLACPLDARSQSVWQTGDSGAQVWQDVPDADKDIHPLTSFTITLRVPGSIPGDVISWTPIQPATLLLTLHDDGRVSFQMGAKQIILRSHLINTSVTPPRNRVNTFLVMPSPTPVPPEPTPIPPGPTPTPVPPTPVPPTPIPPTPTPDGLPFPSPNGLGVIILRESQQTGSLPASQVAIFSSAKLQKWLNDNAAKSGTNGADRAWRLLDDDLTDAHLANIPPEIAEAYRRTVIAANGRLPFIAAANGKTNRGVAVELPKTIDETIALLQPYAGGGP